MVMILNTHLYALNPRRLAIFHITNRKHWVVPLIFIHSLQRMKKSLLARHLDTILLILMTAGLVNESAAQPVSGPSKRYYQETSAKYYYSPEQAVQHNGAKQGDLSIQRFSFDYRLRYLGYNDWQFSGGFYGNYVSLDADSSTPLPSHLQAIGLTVGAATNLTDWLGEGWRTSLFLRPVITSASSFSDNGFVLQGVWGLTYRESDTLTWNLSVLFSTHARSSVLPLPGLRWKFAPDWTLALGFPETALSYRVTPELTLKVMGDYQQGSYRIVQGPVAGLDRTYLDYREIRVGAGADWKIADNISLELIGGAVVHRQFKYINRDYSLKGKTAGYMTLDVKVLF
jgi:hypothetical protein